MAGQELNAEIWPIFDVTPTVGLGTDTPLFVTCEGKGPKTEGGEKKEEVTFVDVTLWARLAEISGEYLKKGKPVFVEGRLQFDTWDDKQTGQKRSRLRVIAESMQLLGARDNGDRPADRTQGAAVGSAPAQQTRPRDPDLDAMPDDIPF